LQGALLLQLLLGAFCCQVPLTKHLETRGGINEKTVSIRVSVLKNYCPIFYGRRCT